MATRRALICRLLATVRQPAPEFRWRSIHQMGSLPAARRPRVPIGEGLLERLRSIGGERIRLDTLAPPSPARPSSVEMEMEVAKVRLGAIVEGSIGYERFVKMCGEGIATALEERGDVVVIGNVVFLRPEQVARAIQSIMPSFLTTKTASKPSTNDPRWSELKELEKAQAAIDVKAVAGVRRELWGGLAYLVAQTALFMRLTFWELSWDVMEPICFYVTSIYFMAGYGFFLQTSKDPSFEGFFESRFASKRRRLMKAEGFDPLRIQELRHTLGICSPEAVKGFCRFNPHNFQYLQAGPRDCVCHRRDGLNWMVH